MVTKWGPDEVSQWLESVGLPTYCHAFKEHEISGTELLSLERRDFKDVGVTKVSTRTLMIRPWPSILSVFIYIFLRKTYQHRNRSQSETCPAAASSKYYNLSA